MSMQPFRGRTQPPKNHNIQNNQGQQQMKRYSNAQQDDINSHQVQVFNDFSNNMMGMMGQNFGMNLAQGFRGFDQMDDQIMGFSDLHNQMLNMPQRESGDGFQMFTQSYVSSSKMGPNGQMQTEKYFDNNQIGKGKDGKTISERQQGYKGNGIDKFAHERMLEAQGKKYVKERDQNGQVSTTHHYYNLDENQQQSFDSNWEGYKRQIGLGDVQNKQLGFQQNFQGSNPQQQRALPSQNYQPQRSIPQHFEPQRSVPSQNYEPQRSIPSSQNSNQFRGQYNEGQQRVQNMPSRQPQKAQFSRSDYKDKPINSRFPQAN